MKLAKPIILSTCTLTTILGIFGITQLTKESPTLETIIYVILLSIMIFATNILITYILLNHTYNINFNFTYPMGMRKEPTVEKETINEKEPIKEKVKIVRKPKLVKVTREVDGK
jgi:hypothetical protein